MNNNNNKKQNLQRSHRTKKKQVSIIDEESYKFSDSKSVNSEIISTNKIFSTIYNNYIGKNIIYNTFNNFNHYTDTNLNYNTRTFNKIYKNNTLPNFNNLFHSIDNTSNIDEKNNKNDPSFKVYNITSMNDEYGKVNIYKSAKSWNNSTYLSNSNIKKVYNSENKHKKIIKINSMDGNTFITKTSFNNDNWKDNNTFYVSNPNKKMIPFQNRVKVFKEPEIKIINLDNQFTKINSEKKFSKIPNNYNTIRQNTSNKQNQYNNQSIKFTSVERTENSDPNLINEHIKTKVVNITNNNQINNNYEQISKTENNKEYHLKEVILNKAAKSKKLNKKMINLNIQPKNLSVIKGYKSFDSHPISSENRKNHPIFKKLNIKINKNSNKINSNNNMTLSRNSLANNKQKKNIINNENKINKIFNNNNNDIHLIYKKENQQSFSLSKDNKSNIPTSSYYITKLKRECELCHQMVDSRLQKVHRMGHPTQIFKYLYLGNFANASNIKELKILKINYILNVAIECKNNYSKNEFKELHLNVKDNENFNIMNFFETANDFINECKFNDGVCLVHCKLGVSRSAAFVIAYLIKYLKFSTKNAIEFIKKKRLSIKPNDGFIKQLYDYEKIIRENEIH